MRTVFVQKSENQAGTRVVAPNQIGSNIVVRAILELMDGNIRVSGFLECIIHLLILFPAIGGIMLRMEQKNWGRVFASVIQR